jgi:hypothetical protein
MTGYNPIFDHETFMRFPSTQRLSLRSSTSSLVLGGAVLVLSACGGAGGSSAIGGSITGLTSGKTLVMQNNGADNFSITGNGANSFTFNFATAQAANSTYNATVFTQPIGETCTIANGSGSVDNNGDNVNSIIVSCAVSTTVTGTVTGLIPGVALTLTSNNENVDVTSSRPSFVFSTQLATGASYSVTIAQQPNGQTCTIANPSGTKLANTPVVLTVSCS